MTACGAKRTSDILHADADSPTRAWAEQAFLGMIQPRESLQRLS